VRPRGQVWESRAGGWKVRVCAGRGADGRWRYLQASAGTAAEALAIRDEMLQCVEGDGVGWYEEQVRAREAVRQAERERRAEVRALERRAEREERETMRQVERAARAEAPGLDRARQRRRYGPERTPRLPFEPLDRLLLAVADGNWRAAFLRPDLFLSTLVAELAGVHRGSVSRWRREGGIPEHAADRVACALGRHPSNVWGAAWWDLANQGLRYKKTLVDDSPGEDVVEVELIGVAS
jgi:hypothetical protein